MGTFCTNLSQAVPIYHGLGLYSLVFALIQVVASMTLLGWLYYEKRRAASGKASAAKSLILPIYFWIVWAFCFAELLQAGANIFLPMQPSTFKEDRSLRYRYDFVRYIVCVCVEMGLDCVSPAIRCAR